MSRSSRFIALARRLWGWFPLTASGLIWGAGVAWALGVGWFDRKDYILGVVGAVGAVVLVLALFTVVLGAVWMGWRLKGDNSLVGHHHVSMVVGRAKETGLVVVVPWFLLVEVDWRLVRPEAEVRVARSGGQWTEWARPKKRGHYHDIVREVTVADVFGLCSIRFRRDQRVSWKIEPDPGALEKSPTFRQLASGEALSHPEGSPHGDLYDMRHYGPGDPVKHILWNVYAKHREVIVRTPERAMAPVDRLQALLVTGDDDEPAAAMAWLATENSHQDGMWRLGVTGQTTSEGDKHQARDAILRSGSEPKPVDRQQVVSFLDGGPAGTSMVMVPGRPGPWLDELVPALQASGRPVVVWICIDGLRHGAQASWWKNEGPSGGVDRSDVAQVIAALRGVAVDVQVVDRDTGAVTSADVMARGSG